MWRYTLGVVALWVVNPEIRRLYDWRIGSFEIGLLSILPLLALMPHVWSLTIGGGWRRLPPTAAFAAWIWLGAFVYGLFVAVLSGNGISGAYDFLNFVLPAGVGLWIAADGTPGPVAYRRVTGMLFGLATFTSVYGIVQYCAPFPWDKFWLDSLLAANPPAQAFGYPAPFQMRVFSTFSDVGAFAFFLALVLLLVLPKVRLARPLLLAQVPIWFVAFALTLVRTGWLMFAVGTIAYVVCAPRRGQFVLTLALSAALIAGLVMLLPTLTGNDDVLTSLNTRVATFSDLDHDRSHSARENLYDNGVRIVATAPLGRGLGVIGTATRLSAGGEPTDFDSGVLGRLLEMGVPGFVLYVMTFIVLVSAAVRVLLEAQRSEDVERQTLAASALSLAAAIVFLHLSHDPGALTWLVFWAVECLAVGALIPRRARAVRLGFA
ncbi:MAG: O-antigen ligase family protein [Candidatus Velthaea sp.]|jgi:hypothetical protein